MNSAKRVSTQTMKNNKKDEKQVAPAENAGNKKIILFSCLGLIIAAIIVMVFWENHHPRVIYTVNGEKVYLGDMMADIYMTESTGDYMDQMYKQSEGPSASFWNAESNDDGITNAELLKDNTLESSMQREMLYKEALEQGYVLSEEDSAKCDEEAASMFDQMPVSVRNKTGLTKEKFVAYYQKKTIADNYKAAWIDTFDIDDDALIKEAGITEEDYRQYDIQYYYIPYSKQADDGSEAAMTDDEKQKAIEELEASYKDIASLEDFTTYINSSTSTTEGEDATQEADKGPKAPEGTNIKYSTKSFIETDEEVFGDDLIKDIKKMDNGAITDGVVEDENGCYIIKMVENNNKERYNTECSNVITEEENKVFQEEIDNLEVEKYYIELNDKEWDKVEFGKVTIN